MRNKDIAAMMGLSPAAFSLIINNKPGVSDTTRERVISQLKEMGYAGLIKGESISEARPVERKGQICFGIYKRTGQIINSHPFFILLMESIEERARSYGYNIMLMTFDRDIDPSGQLETLKAMDISGLILFATEMQSEDLKPFCSLEIPLVALDNRFDPLPVNTVSIDNEMGTWQAVKHLADMGHSRIGHLKSSYRIPSFDEREKGFHSAADMMGIDIRAKDIYEIPYTEQGAYQEFSSVLDMTSDLPTAFVCDDDTMASGAMKALREHGYKIPEDISLVGFNDRPVCETCEPPLTTINVSRSSFGAEGVDALIKLIERKASGDDAGRTLKLRIGTLLNERGSVKNIR